LRYEKKYEIPISYSNIISNYLKSNGFNEIFKSRVVTSLYYDDAYFTNYKESNIGLSSRTKIRARYYDFNKFNFNIEFKRKEDELNMKKFLTPSSRVIGKHLPLNGDVKDNPHIGIKLPENIMNIYYPKVLVSYLRNYFLSSDQIYRITIDTKINFFKAINLDNEIFINNNRTLNQSVLEIKYPNNGVENLEIINLISNKFNLIQSKFSKYCKAVSFCF
tara:strand:+ start:4462 stop:5118 length:657 start_codon:yes stop_codon:yes gene_type:complete